VSAAISVLHITAHLGGGIGKALSGLVLNTAAESPVRHTVVCLEQPKKSHFVERIVDCGCKVVVAPTHARLAALVEDSDIVQLEWWNHPATIGALCHAPLPAMRLLLWCHVSGLHTPIIPRRLIMSAQRCLFTSPCSCEAVEVKTLPPACHENLDVVYSSGGFDGLDLPDRQPNEPLKAGYMGSLNFAKLHPDYVAFLAGVTIPGFTVRMIGDMTNREILELQCHRVGRQGMLDFRGYTDNVAEELAEINVFPYLLNPKHYGTTENAILEAMSMGVVPIVLDNPAERCLITDRETGLVVASREEFSDAITWLHTHPEERLRIGCRAAESVRSRFPAGRMVSTFEGHYRSLIGCGKAFTAFQDIFGTTPADWFLSCQSHPDAFLTDEGIMATDHNSRHCMVERTKGSVLHFLNRFPDDHRLLQWSNRLSLLTHPNG
jgi:glycosyltransferase involved in cell wall biosynthesis